MNGQNIPADASCESCRWFVALDSGVRGYVETHDGHCSFAPPVVVWTRDGSTYTERPEVNDTDLCAQWTEAATE
jgi:hypothetical protein